MKESSTRAFPNGLIPSPLARHVKIFTHWTSGGRRSVSKESWMDIDNLSYMLDHQVGTSWPAWGCGRLSWQLLVPPPEERIVKNVTKWNTIPGLLVVHMKMRKRNKRLTLVYLVPTISIGWKVNFSLLSTWKSVKGHPSIQETSSTAKRTWEYFLDNLQEAHLRIKNANSEFFGQTFWFRTLTPNPSTFRVGWGLPSILLDCSDRNY